MRRFRRPARAAHRLGDFVLGPLRESEAVFRSWPVPKLADVPLGAALEGRSDEELRAAALVLLRTFAAAGNGGEGHRRRGISGPALSMIGRRKLAWTSDEAAVAVQEATRVGPSWYQRRVAGFVASVVEQAGGCPDPSLVTDYLNLVASALSPSDAARITNRLRPFTPAMGGDVDLRVVSNGDEWGRRVRSLLEGIGDVTGIDELLGHLATSSLRPSKHWLAQAEQLVVAAPNGPELLREMLSAALDADLQPRPGEWTGPVMFTGGNAELVRGAAFALALNDPANASLLADAAVHAGTTPSGTGIARDEKVANGCVAALGLIGTDEAVAALGRVQQRVKNRTIRKQVDRALHATATAAGLSVDEIVERSVPSHGLGADRFREVELGDDVVRVAVEGDKVRVLVAKPNSGWATSVPARLRDDYATELSELRSSAKEATKTLGAERARIESLMASDRTWPYADWSRLYREHPLTGAWSSRLLWAVPAGAGDWRAVRLDGTTVVDQAGAPVVVDDTTPVRLWHPIAASAEDVHRWRLVLADLQVRQPFKQVWREVYLLTPAEEHTRVYSNRFAAHILRYPQAFALMKARDWAASALGFWDGGYDGSATKVFPGGRWRARFFYELVEQDSDRSGTLSLCSTDQVRFDAMTGGAWETMPLVDVPPLVFSEAMRDVDLFVGVASIAADPTWIDRGQDRYQAYWHNASFGELTESSETRRLALEQLIPRTKIADRARVEGRFLRVRGRLRTYKIHIGSGNILMEPNDQYLCIVPGGGRYRDRIFLPFEEDGGRLSLIISKAFLLADDHKITDQTILTQITRR